MNPRDLGPAKALHRLADNRRAGGKGIEADRRQGRIAAVDIRRAVFGNEETVGLCRIVQFDRRGSARAGAGVRKRMGNVE